MLLLFTPSANPPAAAEISGLVTGLGVASTERSGVTGGAGAASVDGAYAGADGSAVSALVSGLSTGIIVQRGGFVLSSQTLAAERAAHASGRPETSITSLVSASFGAVAAGLIVGEGPQTEPAYGDYSMRNMRDLDVSAAGDICTVLSIRYAYDWASGEYKKAQLLGAPGQIERYGRITRTLELKWLTSSRQAYLRGERLLGYLSRPRWAISFTDGVVSASIPPGVWVTVAHPHVPVSGRMLTLNCELDPSTASVRITLEAIAGDAPEIALAKLSEAYATQLPDGISVTYAAGFATFTIVDVDGRPIVGAKVTLDGDLTLSTDSFGKVSFQTARGVHHLKIMATGYVTQELDVTV
jgi:hypothetical protein